MTIEFLVTITVMTASGKQRIQKGEIHDNTILQVRNLQSYLDSNFIREVV